MARKLVEKTSNWAQYVAVVSATIVSTVAGINFAWPSPSLPKLLARPYPFNITTEEGSYIAITAPIGCIVGGPLSALFVDKIGRKTTLLLVAIPQFLSFTIIQVADQAPNLLYISRLLGGIGEGANFTIMAMYIGEVAHPSIRGRLGAFISLTLRLGICLVNVVGAYCTITTTAAIFQFLPLLFVATFIWMPETPYYLLMKNEPDKARNTLIYLRQRRDVDDELAVLKADVSRQLSESGTVWELLTIETNRRALLIGLGLRTFQQFGGISAFSLYTQVLFKVALADDDVSPKMAAIIYSTIQLIITFASSFLVDLTGRKPLLILSSLICVLILLIEAIFFTLRDFTTVDVTPVQLLPLIAMLLYVIVFSLGLGTIVNIMLTELFSASIKPKALCILNVYFAIVMMVTTKFFQLMVDSSGLAVPMYVFAGCCLCGAFFCHHYVPETRGKTLEEVQQFLKCPKIDHN